MPQAILRRLRLEAAARLGDDLSQVAVARDTGLDARTIGRLERGRVATISRKSAALLAGYYSTVLEREIASNELGYHVGRLKKEQASES